MPPPFLVAPSSTSCHPLRTFPILSCLGLQGTFVPIIERRDCHLSRHAPSPPNSPANLFTWPAPRPFVDSSQATPSTPPTERITRSDLFPTLPVIFARDLLSIFPSPQLNCPRSHLPHIQVSASSIQHDRPELVVLEVQLGHHGPLGREGRQGRFSGGRRPSCMSFPCFPCPAWAQTPSIFRWPARILPRPKSLHDARTSDASFFLPIPCLSASLRNSRIEDKDFSIDY